ncbi:penicillin-binding protein activator [Acidiphilium acidophilum]|uniref:Penicillin-binding protein activator n=1 Tax=Acidiphilium acidophilum TaxID=76588 RepID=A0AAW9DQ93_ACIAO|nr:penicillin-binding protein activator [Acidiphilium acidophilum]MDX5930811.1 penicillin-binding protein activator [Acidiphilium acidophilum]
MSRHLLTPLRLALATAAATSLLLSGCTEPAPGLPGLPMSGATAEPPSAIPDTGRTSGPVALLLPLSGPFAPIGQSIKQAVQLAFSAPGAPPLDIRDTGGTPQGAAAAASAAIAAGDGLILGPLTKSDTQAVASVAHAANVNVIAFTNDETVAAPGVWPLGITPGQQVSRVVSYAADHGRTRTAAILPDNAFGRLMGASLEAQAQNLGEPSPNIGYFDNSFQSLTHTVRSISAFDSRGASIEAQIRAARDQDDQAGRIRAAKLEREPIPPPPFDALLVGATGEQLAEVGTLLPYYEAGPPQIQLLGPSLWAHDATAMATHDSLRGAVYAAPDPSLGLAFDQKFQSTYGSAPPGIDKIGFDAGAIAVLAAREGGYTMQVLTNPSGFTGTDGVFRLDPDGHVQRGLAVFKVEPGGPQIVSPAPATLPPPTNQEEPAAPPTS